jgi:hypothetical protein
MPLKCGRNLVVILTALISLAPNSFSADKKELLAALAAVEANLKTAAGKQYEEQFGKELVDKYLPSLKQCKQSLPPGTRIDTFDMFLKLKSDGQVGEVLAYPENQLSTCSRTVLLTGKFSRPPHDEYWVNVHMLGQH